MKQNSKHRRPTIPGWDQESRLAVSTGSRLEASDNTPHLLSAQFDDTIKLLIDEMEFPGAGASKGSVAEHYILAAILLQGAQPVVH